MLGERAVKQNVRQIMGAEDHGVKLMTLENGDTVSQVNFSHLFPFYKKNLIRKIL